MKLATLFILSVLLSSSCSDNDDTIPLACGVADPTEDIGWLKNEIEDLKSSDSGIQQYFYVWQGIYDSQTVFVFDNCCPFCNTVVPVYNCQGEQLGFLGNEILQEELKETTIVYKPLNFDCQVDF